jgi:hypothetical protein
MKAMNYTYTYLYTYRVPGEEQDEASENALKGEEYNVSKN